MRWWRLDVVAKSSHWLASLLLSLSNVSFFYIVFCFYFLLSFSLPFAICVIYEAKLRKRLKWHHHLCCLVYLQNWYQQHKEREERKNQLLQTVLGDCAKKFTSLSLKVGTVWNPNQKLNTDKLFIYLLSYVTISFFSYIILLSSLIYVTIYLLKQAFSYFS